MNTKMLKVRSLSDASEIDAYACDPSHPRHRHVQIMERQIFGIPPGMPVPAFMADVEEQIMIQNLAVRPGPDIEIICRHAMARTPMMSSPTATCNEEERFWLPRRAIELLQIQQITKAVCQAHLHPTGCVDWHFLLFRLWNRKPSPDRLFRDAFDAAHSEMNAMRIAAKRPLMPMMSSVKAQLLFEAGFTPLAAQLGSWGMVTADSLTTALHATGHKLGPQGVDVKGNAAHVIHPQSSTSKVYKYDLRHLLDEAQRAYSYCDGALPPAEPAVLATHLGPAPIAALSGEDADLDL